MVDSVQLAGLLVQPWGYCNLQSTMRMHAEQSLKWTPAALLTNSNLCCEQSYTV